MPHGGKDAEILNEAKRLFGGPSGLAKYCFMTPEGIRSALRSGKLSKRFKTRLESAIQTKTDELKELDMRLM